MCSRHVSSPLEDCFLCQRAVDDQDRVAADHELAQALWASELTHAQELDSEDWNRMLSEECLRQHFLSDGTAYSSTPANSSRDACNNETAIKGLDQTGEVAVNPSEPFPKTLCLWDWDCEPFPVNPIETAPETSCAWDSTSEYETLSTGRNCAGAGSSSHVCNHEATHKGPEETGGTSSMPSAPPPADALNEVGVLLVWLVMATSFLRLIRVCCQRVSSSMTLASAASYPFRFPKQPLYRSCWNTCASCCRNLQRQLFCCTKGGSLTLICLFHNGEWCCQAPADAAEVQKSIWSAVCSKTSTQQSYSA